MVREWDFASRGNLKITILVTNKYVDPEKLGIVAADNFGVTAEVFTS